jgi:hypothetical protein
VVELEQQLLLMDHLQLLQVVVEVPQIQVVVD